MDEDQVKSIKIYIKKLVMERDYVTFAELTDCGKSYRGTDGIFIQDTNICFWAGVSPEFCDAVMSLMAQGGVHVVPSATLTYLIDGCAPDMPLAKKSTRYKSPHWCPVVLRPGAR